MDVVSSHAGRVFPRERDERERPASLADMCLFAFYWLRSPYRSE